MGTRSLTHVKEGNLESKTLVTIYRQSDGYPTGMGQDLKNLLGKMKLCNGISMGRSTEGWANGTGCLAAQVVAHLKDGIGNIYIYPPDSSDCWEDYVYTVYADVSGDAEPVDGTLLKMRVEKTVYEGDNVTIYDGLVSKMNCKKLEEK